MRRLLIIPIAMLLLLAGAMWLSGGAAEPRADFSFINRGDINTLDLNRMSYMQDFRLTYGIREGLYDLKPETFKPIPAGATGFDLSDDKKVWTFHLRKDCKWSNGDPVTARDYVFSWRRMLEEPGEYTYLHHNYERNAENYEKSYARGEPIEFSTVGMEAVDDLTFRVSLEYPVPYLLELMAFPPFYPRHERSMAKFRVFADIDVMDTFQQYVDAAQKANRSGSAEDVAKRFSDAIGVNGRTLSADGVAKWLDFAKGFDTRQKTQAELLDALAVFAAMDPLAGVPNKTATIVTPDEDAPKDVFGPLPPAQKLKRMIAARFIRHTYHKAYTLPPDVVTNGPYILRRWDFKRRLLLDKSPYYWDAAHVKCKTIEMVVAETPQAQLLMYETGKVDWQSDVDGEQGAELKARGRTDLHSSPAFGTAFLSLLCSQKLPPSLGGGKNPLADVRVRQALAMTIDKNFIVVHRTRMDELPARTYLPPDGTLPKFTFLPGPFDTSGHAPYTYQEMQKLLLSHDGLTGPGAGLPLDIDRARKLLADAGYPNGQGFPVLPILYNTNSPVRRDICQVLKSQWKQALNIDVEIRGIELKIFSQNVSDKDYWIATTAWYGDYPDISTFTDKYLSQSLQNDSAWVNTRYDDLCDQAKREPDEMKRSTLLSQAENMIDTEVPVIPIYHYVNVSLSPDYVHGCLPNPRNITVFKHIWVDRQAEAAGARR
jgi:oligopeptide transport system substrate-binding protein